MPPLLHLSAVILAAIAGGAMWASLVVLLKQLFNIPEFISGIILNGVAIPFVRFVVNLQTSVAIPDSARFPQFVGMNDFIGLPPEVESLDISLIIADFCRYCDLSVAL